MLLYSSNSKEMLYELWVRTNCKFIFSWGSALCFSGTVVYFLGSHSKFTAFRLTGSPTGDSFLWRSCEDHIPGLFLPSGYYSARETAGLNMWIWILEILWPLVTFILPHLFKPTTLWSIYPYFSFKSGTGLVQFTSQVATLVYLNFCNNFDDFKKSQDGMSVHCPYCFILLFLYFTLKQPLRYFLFCFLNGFEASILCSELSTTTVSLAWREG